jgi:photosystem II stability/assembly factor-like uncharacterized protein
MAVIRVKKMPGFYFGDDAVLLAADCEGMEAFERALSDTKKEHAPSHLIASGTSHEFHIGGSAAQVQLDEGHVIWRLSEEKASEIIDMLAHLNASSVPGHQYVDIDSPGETLILSVEEYLDASWLNED